MPYSYKKRQKKTAKTVIFLRFNESLFLLCGNMAFTFEMQSPLAVASIFLTGYPPILGMVYVGRSYCLQAIKKPSNFKQVWMVKLFSFGREDTAHQNAVFFIWWFYMLLFKFYGIMFSK